MAKNLNKIQEEIEALIYGEDYIGNIPDEEPISVNPEDAKIVKFALIESGVPEDIAEEKALFWVYLNHDTSYIKNLLQLEFPMDFIEILLYTNLSLKEAQEWETFGFDITSNEFGEWFSSFNTPQEASQWRNLGFDSTEALMWGTVVEDPSVAVTLKSVGFTPESYLEVEEKAFNQYETVVDGTE